ncbi:MAG TPA: portal protein [Acidobacteriaceae bacterium]
MPQIPRELDEPAVTDQEIWMECDERLRISIEADGENTKNAIEDLEFEDGFQWPDDLYNQRKIDKRPSLTINMTRRCVREVCNNLRAQRPRIKVHPVGDGARVEDAKVVGGLIRHIENISKASNAYDTAGESAVKIGWGYARVIGEFVAPDSFDQELKIKAIRNQFTCYDDPMAQLPTGADRDFFIITHEMKRSKYKRLYPRAQNADYTRAGDGDVGKMWESKHKIRLAEYYRVTRIPEKLYQLTDGTTLYEKDYLRLKDQLAALMDQQGNPMPITVAKDPQTGDEMVRMSHRRVIEWFKLNGYTVVDRRQYGLKDDKGPIPGHWIPVARCEGNVLELNGQIRRRGMIRDLKDSNRMLNYWATCETELVALAPRAPFIVAEGQIDGHREWKTANQQPHSVLTYKPVTLNPENPDSPALPPPQRIQAVEIPAGVVNARQGAMQDLMSLAGMPHDPRADVPGAVVSGRALRERQSQTDRSHFQYYDNQTMFIAHIGEILLDQIPYYYSTQRMQRIIGEDGVPQMVQINQRVLDPQTRAIMEVKNNLTVGRYDVVMDTGPGYETKRQENAELLTDVLRIPPIAEVAAKTGADLIFRAYDMDDMADRLTASNPEGMKKAIEALPKEAQGIVTSLASQLQQAQQTIQNLQLEIKYKMGVEHMRATVKAHDTETNAETKRRDTDVRATTEIEKAHIQAVTAHDVAEINAGAKLIDSNQDRTHEKELAAMTAAAAEKAERSNGAAQ